MIAQEPRPQQLRDLVSGLRARETWAEKLLVERYSAHIERILVRIGGVVPADLDDRVQDTFLRVFDRIDTLRDPERLSGFVTQVAVNIGRESLRARRRRRWLSFLSSPALDEIPDDSGGDEDAKAAVAATYRILDSMDDDLRIAFALRYIEGMELSPLAEALGVSVATVKRRIVDANQRFRARARGVAELSHWMGGTPQ